MTLRRTLVAVPVLLALACGVRSPATGPSIETLRARAEARPEDPDAQRAVAEAELLHPGGDPARALSPIDRGLALAPDDLRLHLLRGTERELHGEPAEALESFLGVLTRAAESDQEGRDAYALVAAVELERLDDAAPGFADTVWDRLRPIHRAPGRLGPAVRHQLMVLLVDIAYRRGDLEAVEALAEDEACVRRWRVAGPFGPRALLGFDRPLPPDEDRELAPSYDLGPGRGERATRSVEAAGCVAHVGRGPVTASGTSFAEATLEVPTAGAYTLRLETPNPVQLEVDGQRVAQIDRRREPLGRVTLHPMELTAGPHKVRVRLTSRHTNPVLLLSLDPASATIPAAGDRTLLDAYVAAQIAAAWGGIVDARERIRPHLDAGGGIGFLVLGAALTLSDPLRDETVRHDEARRLLTLAADKDPAAWYPRLTLAQLESSENRDLEAIAMLRAATERWPRQVSLALQLAELLEIRGWDAFAEDAIARAEREVPDACRPKRARLDQARQRYDAAEELEVARSLVGCDARSDALLSTWVRRRAWERAAEELARLARLQPPGQELPRLQAELTLAQGRGDDAAAEAILERMREHAPLAVPPLVMQVDRRLGAAQPTRAVRLLEDALAAEGDAFVELRRLERVLRGGGPLAPYRRDGRAVIEAYEASEHEYEGPMVLVFDYTVYRVFHDGSRLELTHNIFRLQSQEAVDQMGEYRVPEGAQLLTLQTVKADGQRLEPDEILGKDTISFPRLSPGDYIEFEYLRPRPSSGGQPGGFIGDRFYFRNYETPFYLSELTVEVPEAIDLVVDPRGQAPALELRQGDGVKVYRWAVEDSRPFVGEPLAAPPTEFFPSILWGHGVTWGSFVETLTDALADRDVRDPMAERLLSEVLAAQEPLAPSTKAERIYRWVLDHIEETGDVFGLAPAMLAAREGSRARILAYLLSLAGIDARLALARSYAGDRTDPLLPDDDVYSNALVLVALEDGPRWLWTELRNAPFGYLPSLLGGQEALVLAPDAPRARVPEGRLEDDLREVEADVYLMSGGGARVEVVETFHGALALGWREQLEEIPAAELERQFESGYVAGVLAPGRLLRLAVSGREVSSEPLVFRYAVELDAFARGRRDGIAVPPVYTARLVNQYAPLAERRTPQMIAVGVAFDVDLRIHPAANMAPVSGPADATLQGPFGATVDVRSELVDDVVTIERRYRIPRMRLSPDEYPAFAEFARSADEAEAGEVRLSVR